MATSGEAMMASRGDETGPGHPISSAPSLDELAALRDALDSVEVIRSPAKRRQLVRRLREALPALDDEQLTDDADSYDVLLASTEVAGGLEALVTALRLVGGPTSSYQAFTARVASIGARQALTTDQYDELEALLGTVSATIHLQAVIHPSYEPHAGLVDDLESSVEVLQLLYPPTDPGTAWALLHYLELVGHQLEQVHAIAAHRLTHHLALGGPHRADLARLCGSLGSEGIPRSDVMSALAGSSRNDSVRTVDGDNVITVSVREVAPPPIPAANIWGGVPPRNRNFTGRVKLLAALREALIAGATTTLIPQALFGLGGVGKSQAALEFAYSFRDDYELVWWISAEDERSIRRSLVSLAKRLGMGESQDADDAIGAVLDALRHGRPHARWLLIYDNAGDPETLLNYRPVAGPGHVLITSRSNKWSSQVTVIPVDVFAESEAVEFLTKRWIGLDPTDAVALSQRLGYLPLAIEQAAAIHERTGMSLEEFFEALAEKPEVVMEEGAPTGYGQTVAATFRIAYTRLKERSPAAAQLFGVCAALGSQQISFDMMVRGRAADLPSPLAEVLRQPIERRIAVREICDHALATLDAGRNLIGIHNLNRDLLRASLRDDERKIFESAAHGILALANPGEPDTPANWPSLNQINPHIDPSGILLSPNPEARSAYLDQIRYLYAIGDYRTSRTLGERAADAWTEKYGPDDEMTLLANRHLANSLREMAEYDRVQRINVDTLSRLTAVFGRDHDHTLATANSAAADLRLLGRYLEAMELDKENLRLYETQARADELAQLRSSNNLAVDYRLLGLYEEALKLDEANVRRRQDMFGEDDPRTLAAYMGLVQDRIELGDYQWALSTQLQKLRSYDQQGLSPNHREVLRARRNVAILYRKVGETEAALAEARSLYDIHTVVFGLVHEQTHAALLTLSSTLLVAGDVEAAVKVGTEAKQAYETAFGTAHPMALAASVNLAIALRHNEDARQAATINDTALGHLRATMRPDHPWTLCALANQASILADLGEAEAARTSAQQALTDTRRVRGDDHPYTLACAANLALDLFATDQPIEANALRSDTVARLRARLGPRHPDTIAVGLDTRLDCDISPPTI